MPSNFYVFLHIFHLFFTLTPTILSFPFPAALFFNPVSYSLSPSVFHSLFLFQMPSSFFFTLSHFFTPTSFIFSFPFPATLFPVTFHTVHVSIFISLPSSSVKCRQTFFLSHQMFTFLHIHSVHTSSPCQILPMPRPLVPPILWHTFYPLLKLPVTSHPPPSSSHPSGSNSPSPSC